MMAWTERHAAAARTHPDLVAVYESHRGRLALLFRQTPVPLVEERRLWLADTRRAAAGAIASLRAAGLADRCVVLQWCPLGVVARVLARWTCRYDGDPARHGELRRVVERYMADRAFLASRLAEPAAHPEGRAFA